MTKTIGRVIGPLGALFVLFALFARIFITGEFNWIVWTQMGLGLAGVGVWAATAFDDARNVATGRGTQFVAVSVIATVLALSLLGALNFVATKKKKEWDLTKGGIHTLAEQTTGMLSKLTPASKVTVTAFFQPLVDREYQALEDLLKRYKAAGGDNFDYSFVDAAKNPALAKQYSVTAQGPRIILKAANGKESRAKEPTEEALTNALAELGKGVEKKVYFLTAHGEKPAGKGNDTGLGLKLWTDGLANEGYRSEELNLLARKDVPEDALAVVVAGPQSPLAEGEVGALKRYADGGGRLVVMVDPGIDDQGLVGLVASWGVEVQKGIVVDPDSQEALWAFSQEFSEHPLAQPRRTLLGALAFVFPEARGVKKGAAAEGFEVTELFKTGRNAWGETSPLPADGRVERDATDEAGPVSLAIAVTKKAGEKEFRAVVFGDSEWATNQFVRQGGNRDLALNTIQWLGGDEQKITIRPKLREKSTLAFLTANQRLLLSFGSLNVLPLLLIGIGLSIWSVRRSK